MIWIVNLDCDLRWEKVFILVGFCDIGGDIGILGLRFGKWDFVGVCVAFVGWLIFKFVLRRVRKTIQKRCVEGRGG